MKKVTFTLYWILLIFPVGIQAQQAGTMNFNETANRVAGIYQFNDHRHVIIMPHPDLELLSFYDMETGDVQPLEQSGDADFQF